MTQVLHEPTDTNRTTPLKRQPESDDEGDQLLRVKRPDDIAILTAAFHVNEQENRLFYDLYSIFETTTSETFLLDIWDASPWIYFFREKRTLRDRLDRFKDCWSRQYPSLEDPTAENPTPSSLFKDHYRVNRSTFNIIVQKCKSSSKYTEFLGCGIPVEIQVATVLWRFSNCKYGRRILEYTMDLSAESLVTITERFADALREVSKELFEWPIKDPAQAAAIAQGFKESGTSEDDTRLDQVIGAIDGKVLIIQKPNIIDAEKARAVFNFMSICDYKGRYMYSQIVGSTGSQTCKSSRFKSSSIWRGLINEPERLFPNDTYIIGDLAYPLVPNLMTPFKNTGNDAEKERYNVIHAKTREKVEESFKIMTSRWKFLWKLDDNANKLAQMMWACCVLHNICIDENDRNDYIDTRGYHAFADETCVEFENIITICEELSDTRVQLSSTAETKKVKNLAEARRIEIMRKLNQRML